MSKWQRFVCPGGVEAVRVDHDMMICREEGTVTVPRGAYIIRDQSEKTAVVVPAEAFEVLFKPGCHEERRLNLDEIQSRAFRSAQARGFWPSEKPAAALISEAVLHMHSEVKEFHTASDRINAAEELADIIILCGSLAEYLRISLAAAVRDKLALNEQRALVGE